MHVQIPKSDEPPPVKPARPESEFLLFRFTWVKLPIYPPVTSERQQSDLFTVQCCS